MPRFFIQEHHARHLHWDLRLEVDGVLKSWALPKGPSTHPAVKRLALEMPDHELSYGPFEGSIPRGHYGAGDVKRWDSGEYRPLPADEDVQAALRRGHVSFVLRGSRLKGGFSLIRLKGERQPRAWLLVKQASASPRHGRPVPETTAV